MSTSPPESTVYFNGAFVTAAEARIPIGDQGLLYGLGFFETFRSSGGRPHHWAFNRRRLVQACAAAGLVLPAGFLAADEARLGEVVQSLLREQAWADGVFRYTVTAGSGGMPSEFLTTRPLPPTPDPDGICLRVLNLARDNGEWLPRPKSLNYANALLGADELHRRTASPADEGLFLTRDEQYVVETTRQNVAWVRDDRFYYPDPSLGAVAGTCLAWALELGGWAEPQRIRVDVLRQADAILVLNSVRGVTPVREIRDGRDQVLRGSIESARHPLVVALHRQWSEALQATARV